VRSIGFFRAALRFLTLLAAGAPTGWAAAQDEPTEPAQALGPGVAPGVAPGVGPGVVAGGEVRLVVEAFGVGGVVRPGELVGVRLGLTDTADKPREVVVRMRLPDADGDTTVYQRAIALNPGRAVALWLYGRLPWQLKPSTIITFSVNMAQPTVGGGLEIGRQIGALRITPGSVQTTIVDPEVALGGVVGRRGLGLENYTQNIGGDVVAVSGHEALRIVTDLTPLGFPDQWEGWSGYETIVWGQGEPSEIEGDMRASALIEWVHRGGRLVIVTPTVANPWIGGRNALSAILPRATPERVVEADLDRYRSLLTLERTGATHALPHRVEINRFVIPGDATTAEATPVILGPDGCVVVRRLVGVGMVTMVGLPINEPAVAPLVRADAFWNRILGRRTDQISAAEAEASRWRVGGNWTQSAEAQVDGHIADQIATNRAASWGIVLALVVFFVYWLMAGPAGFAILKSRGYERHSWVAFVVMSGMFTVVAWVGAGVLRPKQAQEWHYTILDHVYGQPVQRARSFVSVLLPQYGEQTVTLGDAGVDTQWRQALTPWADPTADAGLRFPDAREYVADVRNLTSLTVPARSTVKQFQAEWLGGPRWSTPAPAEAGTKPALSATGVLSGALVHALPGPLVDVRVILVAGQTTEAEDQAATLGKSSGRLRARAWAWARTDAWAPGQRLELSAYNDRSRSGITALLRDLTPTISLTQNVPGLGGARGEAVARRELAAALFGVLEPPDYTQRKALGETAKADMSRFLTHTMDLGAWFTQPCLIVIGAVEDQPGPVPMGVDGAPLDGKRRPARGRTVVRWVYPLDPAPVRFGAADRGGAS